MVPQQNQPAAVTAVITDAFVSSFNIHMPSIRNSLFRRFGPQGLGYFATVETLGFVDEVAQTNWSHFEEDFYHQTFINNIAIPDPGAGNAVNITISPLNVDSNGYFYPRINDNILFPNQVTGIITNINTNGATPVLTVVPDVATDDIGPIAANQQISIYSNSWPEDTDQPDGRIAKVSQFSFGAKIMKEAVISSGTEMTNQLWYDHDSDGRSIQVEVDSGQFQADFRMMLQIDGAALFDKPITNPLSPTGQRKMTGLVPWMQTNSSIGTYTPGLFSLSNVDTMIKTLTKNFAPNEFLWMEGINLQIDVRNSCSDFFVENPRVFAGNADGSLSQDLNLGFSTIRFDDFQFHLQKMNVFSNPEVYNIPGYSITSLGLVCPLSYRQDTKTRESVPTIGMRYKSRAGYSRKMEFWTIQGAGNGPKQITRDRKAIEMRSEMGTEFFGANQFFLWMQK